MSLPQSKWVSIESSGDETNATAFERLTSSNSRGNYYIDSVYFQVCPEKGHYATQALLKSCNDGTPTANWSGAVNLLSSTSVDISTSTLASSTAILNPILYVRFQGGDSLGKVVRVSSGSKHVEVNQLTVKVGAQSYQITEGLDWGGTVNQFNVDTSTPDGTLANSIKSSLFAVGWGQDQIVNNFNTSESDPANGVYAYDFPVSHNSSGARLVYRTYLTMKDDDNTAIRLSHEPTNGYTCCDRM